MKYLLSNEKISWAVFGLAFGVVSCLLLPLYFEWIKISGYEIPQDDLVGDYFVGVLWACVLGISILIWPVPKQDKTALLWAWLAKVFVTLGFLLVYEWIYGDDQWSYFVIPLKLDFEPYDYHFIQTGGFRALGTRNIDHIVWWHEHIFPEFKMSFPSGSYHALKTSFSMVGLIAIYIFYRAGMIFTGEKINRTFFYILALTPTDLIWSSTLGKEPIVLFGIALYVYGVVAWQKKGQISALIFSFAGILLVGSIRTWMAPILIFPFSVFFVFGRLNFFIKAVLFGLFLYVSGTATEIVQLKSNFESVLDEIAQLSEINKSGVRGGSGQEHIQFTTIKDILVFAPFGIFTALFRPLPGDVLSPLGLMASFEGAFFLWLFMRAWKRSSLKDIINPIICWGIFVILAWTSVYAFVSYQNLGTTMRWRLQILPIFLGLLLYLGRDREKKMPTPVTQDDIPQSQIK